MKLPAGAFFFESRRNQSPKRQPTIFCDFFGSMRASPSMPLDWAHIAREILTYS